MKLWHKLRITLAGWDMKLLAWMSVLGQSFAEASLEPTSSAKGGRHRATGLSTAQRIRGVQASWQL